jgi:hypothetical protein
MEHLSSKCKVLGQSTAQQQQKKPNTIPMIEKFVYDMVHQQMAFGAR